MSYSFPPPVISSALSVRHTAPAPCHPPACCCRAACCCRRRRLAWLGVFMFVCSVPMLLFANSASAFPAYQQAAAEGGRLGVLKAIFTREPGGTGAAGRAALLGEEAQGALVVGRSPSLRTSPPRRRGANPDALASLSLVPCPKHTLLPLPVGAETPPVTATLGGLAGDDEPGVLVEAGDAASLYGRPVRRYTLLMGAAIYHALPPLLASRCLQRRRHAAGGACVHCCPPDL